MRSRRWPGIPLISKTVSGIPLNCSDRTTGRTQARWNGTLTANIGSYSDGKPAHRAVSRSKYSVIRPRRARASLEQGAQRILRLALSALPMLTRQVEPEPQQMDLLKVKAIPQLHVNLPRLEVMPPTECRAIVEQHAPVEHVQRSHRDRHVLRHRLA